MDLTTDGEYLFAADYGGTRTGYGTPLRPHWVHRYDLTNRTWQVAQAPKIAWKIEAVGPDRVLLQEYDQWVDITLNRFGDTMQELFRAPANYRGDMEFDPARGRIYHGNSGMSSREIDVLKLTGDNLTGVQFTGGYGTAQNGGGTSVLSTDGYYFYYGRLQVEADNVSHNLRFYPEIIYAASDHVAFGQNNYYYAETGVQLGTLGYPATVYGVSEDGSHLWAFKSTNKTVYHYTISGAGERRLFGMAVTGPAIVGSEDTAQFTAMALYLDGSSENVTAKCQWSIDQSIYGNINSQGLLTTLEQAGIIRVTAAYTESDRTLTRSTSIECIPHFGKRGVIEIESYSLNAIVAQIKYLPARKLLFLRQGGNAVWVVDAVSRTVIETHPATESFTDMDLTADSRYLFVADYGGTHIGYGTPLRPHWVHRYDLANRTWQVAQAPKIAWKIEAVGPDRVLLQEYDQWIHITLNRFGDTMQELFRVSADYYGDMEFDPARGRIYHGNSNLSSREIDVFNLTGDTLVAVQGTGTYGTAQNGGGSSVLSTDGKYFFYGKLQVDALDVRTNVRMLPQTIYAASDWVAFGDSRYYSIQTGEELSGLGFSSTVYDISQDGHHLWAYQSQGNRLHHYFLLGTNLPPTASISADNRTVEAQGPQGATVHLDGSASSDPNSLAGTYDDIVAFTWYEKTPVGESYTLTKLATDPIADVILPLGDHTIVLEVTDRQGAKGTAEAVFSVKDTLPPEFKVTIAPTVLWPVNHRLVKVTPSWDVHDICDENPQVSLVSIAVKDGKLSPQETQKDVYIDPAGGIFLRAERQGSSINREYILTFQAVDSSGNKTLQSVTVTVPHDQR